MSKYPEAYAAYRKRVAKFVPFLTPVYGVLLGEKERKRVEGLVFGEDVGKKAE